MANSKRLREALLQSSKAAVQSGRSAAPGVAEQSGSVWLPVSDILPDPGQPRTSFDDEAMAKLVESIRSLGQIEPILVEPLRAAEQEAADGRRYRCMSGHRRLRAHELLGLSEIKATIVRDALTPSDRFMHEIASNEARADHTDYDRARFLATVFAERLGVDGDPVERVKYLVNRAFNEYDRTGAFGKESEAVVETCEEALRALGERRNLRWFHRWGLPLLALKGAAREAAVAGLDARRALALGQLASKGRSTPGRDAIVAEVAAIARRSQLPHREIAHAVRDIAAILEKDGESSPRIRALVDALRKAAERETEGPAETQEKLVAPAAPRPKPPKTPPDIEALRRRAASLSVQWSVTIPAKGRRGRGAVVQTPVADVIATLPRSARHRAERLLHALEKADRELASLIAASLEGES